MCVIMLCTGLEGWSTELENEVVFVDVSKSIILSILMHLWLILMTFVYLSVVGLQAEEGIHHSPESHSLCHQRLLEDGL